MQADFIAGFINLIANNRYWHASRQLLHKFGPDEVRVDAIGFGAVDHKQYPVGLINRFPGAGNTDLFHFIRAFAQTGGINNMQWHAINVDVFFQYIPSGTGDIGYDGAFTAGQRIKQARFTGIGFAGNNYLHTFP